MILRRPLAAALAALCLTAAGASASHASAPEAAAPAGASRPVLAPMQTNLASARALADLQIALRRAGVSEARIRVLTDHVTQFNQAVGTATLAGAPIPLGAQRWDEYALQDAWTAKHPDFAGYNCRITSFGIYGGNLTIDTRKPARADLLFLDHEALDADPSALLTTRDRARFDRLWSTTLTSASTSVPVQVRALQRDWAARGIRFSSRTDIRLISVVMHDTIDGPQLFVGHTGVLLPQPDGSLLFVEKLAFQKPYQVTRFASRAQLADYLMSLYDDGMTDAARPFVMENGSLMQGYRPTRSR